MATTKKKIRKLALGGKELSPLEQSALDYRTRQEPDPFSGFYNAASPSGLTIIEPSIAPESLQKLPLHNNTLLQCIAAMTVNIEGFGYQLDYIGKKGEKLTEEAQEEKDTILALLEAVNSDEDITQIRQKLRSDYETFGYAYMELIKDPNGNVIAAYHIPAQTMRKTTYDKDPTEYIETILRKGSTVKIKKSKNFRRYVQIVQGKLTYFAEAGDPRPIDPLTGNENSDLAFEDRASEIVCFEQYSTGEQYALPRWINQLPSILGSREAEETNLGFFKDNAIPAMVVTVGGGSLSQESIDAIETQFSKNTGKTNMHKVLVLEAIVDEEMFDMEGKPIAPKIDIKPLANDRAQDALFLEYDRLNSDKVRSSFRIPPIFLGNATDYTRATAEASIEVAESQVFSPERRTFDKIINAKILNAGQTPTKYWKVRSNPVKMTGSDSLLRALERLNNIGAMTPNTAIAVANEYLDLSMPPVSEAWGDAPFHRNIHTGDNPTVNAPGEGPKENMEDR